jgi:molybdenum cofactor guanylyltransferase
MNVATLILAGGEARRMGGGDKPLLPLGGRPVLAHVIERVSPPVAIGANGDPARFVPFGLPVLPDPPAFARRGPLAGLAAGLAWAGGMGAEALLLVPGDAPFLPRDLARRLAPGPALAARGGRRHPTCSLWPASLGEALARHLAGLDAADRRAWSMLGFAGAVGARVVEFADDGCDPFADIDTPDDLLRARRVVAEVP